MSGLTKKQVFVDRNLSAILGVREGELVSYAEIQKNLHKYIKENDLKNTARTIAPLTLVRSGNSTQPTLKALKRCVDCGSEIPQEASYCDICGVAQGSVKS